MPTFRGSGRSQVGRMSGRLAEIEKSYGMTPQREEEEEDGFFGPRGFFGNISDYYQTENWGDWWRGLFGRQQEEETRGREEEEDYTVYPEWGEGNIRTLRDIMRGRED